MQSQQFPIVALEGHAADNERSPNEAVAGAGVGRAAGPGRARRRSSRLLARASGTSAPVCRQQSECCRSHERTVEFGGSRLAGPPSPLKPTRRRPRPSPAQANRPAEAAPATIPLESVEFKKGSAVLGPASLANLDVVAGFMKGTPTAIEIVGYADDNERKLRRLW